MLPVLGGCYLGWTLGANDAANVFGTAVASRVVSFRKACLLCALAVILGAALQGHHGIDTISGLFESQGTDVLLVITLAAAVTVTLMTLFRLPISTSQALVGAIVGIGLATDSVHWAGLIKVVVCWIATPIGAMIVSCIVYKLLGGIIEHVPMSMLTRDKILWGGLLIVGTYGSYALGANNVANVTGVFSNRIQGLSDFHLALIGGVAIAGGVLTFSRRVMMTVGSGVMRLDAFTALVAVASMAVTVHAFAVIGVPVSSSQGIIGAIMGIGLIRGTHVIRFRSVARIGCGWLLTPAISLILSAAGYAIFCGGAE
jgi:PiT family inorganic phosphate transporter